MSIFSKKNTVSPEPINIFEFCKQHFIRNRFGSLTTKFQFTKLKKDFLNEYFQFSIRSRSCQGQRYFRKKNHFFLSQIKAFKNIYGSQGFSQKIKVSVYMGSNHSQMDQFLDDIVSSWLCSYFFLFLVCLVPRRPGTCVAPRWPANNKHVMKIHLLKLSQVENDDSQPTFPVVYSYLSKHYK